ncbi:MAG TPA: ATP-binding protein [Gaiellales bacterium]|nr:ATP-binding protein [Gaiellales bacterium]
MGVPFAVSSGRGVRVSRGSKWFRIAVADVARGSVDVRLACAPSTPADARHLVVDLCERCGVGEQLMPDVALAVSEAAANATAHAYPDGADGDVDLWASVGDETLTVVLRDYGSGMAAPAGADGLGIALMRALADSCEIEQARPGTCVRLRFGLRPASV